MKKYIEYENLLNLIIGKGELLTDWEYKFCRDMLSKQTLTPNMTDKIAEIWNNLIKREEKERR